MHCLISLLSIEGIQAGVDHSAPGVDHSAPGVDHSSPSSNTNKVSCPATLRFKERNRPEETTIPACRARHGHHRALYNSTDSQLTIGKFFGQDFITPIRFAENFMVVTLPLVSVYLFLQGLCR